MDASDLYFDCLEQVGPSKVLATLKAWSAEQKSLCSENEAPVDWQQINFLFCNLKNHDNILFDDLLFFSSTDSLDPFSLTWPEQTLVYPREVLVFVTYRDQFSELTILGWLTCPEYATLAEYAQIRLCDLHRSNIHMKLNSVQNKAYQNLKSLHSYYEPTNKNKQPFLDIYDNNYLKRADMIDTLYSAFSKITGMRDNSSKLKSLNLDQLKDHLQYLCIPEKQEHLTDEFQANLVWASLSKSLHTAFEEYETSLLKLRFELFYTTEHQRAVFVRRWFPQYYEIRPLTTKWQFYNLPPGVELQASTQLEQDEIVFNNLAHQHVAWCRRYRLDPSYQPFPSVGFIIDSAYALSVVKSSEALMVDGKMMLTHYPTSEIGCELLKQFIIGQIAFIHRTFNLQLARTQWSRLHLPLKHYNMTPHQSIQIFKTRLGAQGRELFDEIILPSWYELCTNNLFTNLMLPLLCSLDGFDGNMERHAQEEWPTKDNDLGAVPKRILHSAESDYEVSPIEFEVMPDDRAGLLQMANKIWPPCMVKLVTECVGQKHLIHAQRVKLSAFIRVCNYNQAQAQQLWWLTFSETRVGSGCTSKEDFFETSQGRVICDDYKSAKLNDLGVSCQSVINANMCPMRMKTQKAASLSLDIENCQMACKGCFKENNPSKLAMRFPVSSPKSYVSVAREIHSIPPPVFESAVPTVALQFSQQDEE